MIGIMTTRRTLGTPTGLTTYKENIMSEEITYKRCTIKVEQDEDAQSPREWSNVGKMLCRHPRYTLGDEQPSADTIIEITKREDMIWLPLYLYDHSGLTMRAGATSANWIDKKPFVGDSAGWDTSTVGIIYCTKKQAIEEWGNKICTKAVYTQAVRYLQGEVDDYSNYLEGDVCGYSTETPEGEQIDSCWGFFPDDTEGYGKRWNYMLGQAKSSIDSWRSQRVEQLREERNGRQLALTGGQPS